MHRLLGTGWSDQLLWQREGRIGALGTNTRRFVRGKKGADAPQATAHQDTRRSAARAPDAIRCVWTALTPGYSHEVA